MMGEAGCRQWRARKTANKQQHDGKKASANFMRGGYEVQAIHPKSAAADVRSCWPSPEAQKSLRGELRDSTIEGNMPVLRLLRLVGGPTQPRSGIWATRISRR